MDSNRIIEILEDVAMIDRRGAIDAADQIMAQLMAEQRAALAAEREYRMKVEAERDALCERVAALDEDRESAHRFGAINHERAEALRTEADELRAAVVKLSEELGTTMRERDALREQVGLLRAKLDDCREELFEIERDE